MTDPQVRHFFCNIYLPYIWMQCDHFVHAMGFGAGRDRPAGDTGGHIQISISDAVIPVYIKSQQSVHGMQGEVLPVVGMA